MMMMKQLSSIAFALVLTSCSSGSTGGSSGSSGNPFGGGALDGTWDVVVTSAGGKESRGTITISPTLFAMSFGDFDLNGAMNGGTPDVTAKDGNETKKLPVTVTQQPFDTGAISFPIGGTWTIGEKGECSADMKIPTMTLNCGRVSIPENVDRWLEGNSFAQRTSTKASSFGELGGTWTVTAPRGKVEVTFEGSTFTAKGIDDGVESGSVTMTFNGGTASGSATDGAEVAATRR